MIDLNSRLLLLDDVSSQSLGPGQDTVVLSLKSGKLYRCNEVAARFIRTVDGKRSIADIAAEIEREYDAARNQLERDLLALAADLVGHGLAQAL